MAKFCTECGQPVTPKNISSLVCEAGHDNWLNPATASSVFVVKDGKVLFGRRNRQPGLGMLDRPGGFIEINETAENAAIRETKEEFGIDIRLIDFLGSYADYYGDRPNLNLTFVGEIVGGTPQPGDGIAEVVWLDIANLPEAQELAAAWFPVAQADFLKWWANNKAPREERFKG